MVFYVMFEYSEEVAEKFGYADLKCFWGNSTTAALEAIAFGLTNNGIIFLSCFINTPYNLFFISSLDSS